MNDDLDELDLSDFTLKPPDQLRDDQLQVFMAEQDEELARFLQIYENQKKNTLVRDKQELQENQDYEIARLIYEEEKAKLRRLKEKRLKKQRMKQAQQFNNKEPNPTEFNNQPEYYIPDNRLYRLPNQSNEPNSNQEEQYLNEEQSLYDEPPQEDLTVNYSNQANGDRTQFENSYNENSNEETNLKYLDNRPASSNSSNHSQIRNDSKLSNVHRTQHIKSDEQLRYNAVNHTEDNAQYTLSTKQHHQANQNVFNFVNRALPPVPPAAKFHNIAMDLDPTYNKSKKDKSEYSLSSNTLNSSVSTDSTNLQANSSPQVSGLHYAQLAQVENGLQHLQQQQQHLQNEYDLAEQHCSNLNTDYNQQFDNSSANYQPNQLNQQMNNPLLSQNNGQNYVMHQQSNANHYMPVQGQKRTPTVATNQKKASKKEKGKEKCRQQ